MTYHIKTETIDQLIIMLNQQYVALETLRESHYYVDLSVNQLTRADYTKVEQYAKLTESLRSTKYFNARSNFLNYYNFKLTSEDKSSLYNYTFPLYQGLDQVRQITFAEALGLEDHQQPGYLTSIIELWQFVVTVDPTKKDLIPESLKDYARQLLYTFGTTQSLGITRPRQKRSWSLASADLPDNTNVVTADNPEATPMLSSLAALNIGTSQTAFITPPKKKKSRSQGGRRLFNNTNVMSAENSSATQLPSMISLNTATSQTAFINRPKKKKSRSQVGFKLFDNTKVMTAESSSATPLLSMIAQINRR